MFTGIIRELGTIKKVTPNQDGAILSIESPKTLETASVGDSIAVNGTCLTVTEIKDDCWTADVVKETMGCTSLGELQPGHAVNLERPVSPTSAMDGHFVQGHVDGTGVIKGKQPQSDGSTLVEIDCPASIMNYVVPKGSIAVDGVSLTVVNTEPHSFSFAMIPHTAQWTTLGAKGTGEKVNLEVDILAKYVEKLIQNNPKM